jgi:hypothetical protein
MRSAGPISLADVIQTDSPELEVYKSIRIAITGSM